MALPWERLEKSYRFEGPNGALSLADLFDGRSQLIVYHFMFGPPISSWTEFPAAAAKTSCLTPTLFEPHSFGFVAKLQEACCPNPKRS